MALSDLKILSHMREGDIVIDPFREDHLNTSSYDVSLGEWYYREQRQNFPVFNIWSEKHTQQVWGLEPSRALPARDVFRDLNGGFCQDGVSDDDLVILITPGETILGHTQEFIGGLNCITTQMQARSSMGRNFIEVCKCAGWGDVGFTNRWTMEITNNSRFYSIPLVVGRRIAQIVFLHTGPIQGADYAQSGKYQTSTSLAEIKRSWDPSMMLPRLYKDREITRDPTILTV